MSTILTELEIAQNNFMLKVYSWMTFGLIITGTIASVTASSPAFLKTITGGGLFTVLIIAELLLVWGIGLFIKKLSSLTAGLLFILYSAVNGLTLSVIFLIYTSSSIGLTFFVTAGTFAIMSMYGYVTKRDLTSIGNFCIMALIGLIIATIVNIFLWNGIIYWITTYVGVIIFVLLTAFDTQKLKNMNLYGNSENVKKAAIIGALTLYLDFINLFLHLLRIFGSRNSRN